MKKKLLLLIVLALTIISTNPPMVLFLLFFATASGVVVIAVDDAQRSGLLDDRCHRITSDPEGGRTVLRARREARIGPPACPPSHSDRLSGTSCGREGVDIPTPVTCETGTSDAPATRPTERRRFVETTRIEGGRNGRPTVGDTPHCGHAARRERSPDRTLA